MVAFTPREDGFDEARREKLRRKRCPECGRLKNAEDNARQLVERPSGRVKKGQESKHLPDDTRIVIWRRDDGHWLGTLRAGGIQVETASPGTMGLISKLARKYLRDAGAKLTGKVTD